MIIVGMNSECFVLRFPQNSKEAYSKPLDLPSATRISPNRELWNSMDIGDYIK